MKILFFFFFVGVVQGFVVVVVDFFFSQMEHCIFKDRPFTSLPDRCPGTG